MYDAKFVADEVASTVAATEYGSEETLIPSVLLSRRRALAQRALTYTTSASTNKSETEGATTQEDGWVVEDC